MNVEEFSQKIKTKYPEYKDMDDNELTSKIIAKYPEYSDVVSDEPTVASRPEEPLGPRMIPKDGSQGIEPVKKFYRRDGTEKGDGWLGVLKLPSDDGKDYWATEYTVVSDAVMVNGKHIDFPSLVPTLSDAETEDMVTNIMPNKLPIPEHIMRKAIDHANKKIKSGESVFAPIGNFKAPQEQGFTDEQYNGFDERKRSLADELVKRGAMNRIPTPEQPKESSGATAEFDFIKPMSWKSVMRQAVGNTPKSGVKFVEDIITPFTQPIDTVKAIGGLAQGLGQKFIPGTQEQEYIVDDLADMFKERYGGLENFKKTLAEDPVGVSADIATLLVPVGKVAQTVGTVSKTAKLAKAGKAIAKVGEVLEPIGATGKIIKKTAGKVIPQSLINNTYQRGIKLSKTIPSHKRKKLVATGLKEEIMPNYKGLDKLRGMIDELNTEITKKIDDVTSGGEAVPIEKLLNGIEELKKEQLFSGDATSNIRAIENTAKQLVKENKKVGRTSMNPKQVQKLKKKLYAETERLYDKMMLKPIKAETKQLIAKNAKEWLEELAPEIKQLNKKEGSLIALRKQLDNVADGLVTKDLLDTGVQIKGGIGAAVGGGFGAAGGAALGLLDSAQVRAKLAIVAKRLKKKGVVLADDNWLKQYLELAPSAVTLTARQSGKLTDTLEEGKLNE